MLWQQTRLQRLPLLSKKVQLGLLFEFQSRRAWTAQARQTTISQRLEKAMETNHAAVALNTICGIFKKTGAQWPLQLILTSVLSSNVNASLDRLIFSFQQAKSLVGSEWLQLSLLCLQESKQHRFRSDSTLLALLISTISPESSPKHCVLVAA